MPILIRCPSCQQQLRVPDEVLGRTVRCPACKQAFPASAEDEPPPSRPARRPAPPRLGGDEITDRPERSARRPRRPEPEYEEDDSDRQRPVRRARRVDEDYEEPEPEDYEEEDDRPRRRRRKAAGKVLGPAIGLMVVGGLGILIYLFQIVVLLAGGQVGFATPNVQDANDPAYRFGQYIGSIIPIIWGIFVLSGAIQMMRLKGYGLAMTACITGLIPCNICCLLGLPFGIWGLVAINDTKVKKAFR